MFELTVEEKDFHKSYEGTHKAREIDLMTDEYYPIKGLDFIFHNMGASSIILRVDRRTSKTVKKLDVYNWLEKSDFYVLEIINASEVAYELVVWGERVSK